jgi:hypothetical protein
MVKAINLTLRFFLELFGLFALGYWGWTQHSDVPRYAWAFGLPLGAAILWGTFRVNDDPGKAPVAIPGWMRLLLEAFYFSAGVWCLYAAGEGSMGLAFGIIILIHYLVAYDRVIWLLKQP